MLKEVLMADAKTGVARWNEENGGNARRSSDDNRKRIISLVILAILTVAFVVCFSPLPTTVTRGLYFKGGEEASFDVTAEDGKEASSDDIANSVPVIKRRLNDMGIVEFLVSTDASHINIAVPERYDVKEVAPIAAGQGLIEFCELDEIGDADALELIQSGASNVEIAPGTYTPFVDSSHIARIEAGERGVGNAYLAFEFDDEGAKTLEEVTERLAEDSGSVAVIASGHVITMASVPEKMTGGQVSVPISAGLLAAKGAKACFDSGTIPVRTTLAGSSHVGAKFGDHISLIVLCVCAAAILAVSIACFMRYRKLAILVLGTGVIYALWVLGMAGIASRAEMYLLTIPAACAGVLAGAASLAAAWMAVRYFVNHVNEGGTFKGGAIAAGRVGLRPMLWPTLAALTICVVFIFIPMALLSQFGMTGVFGVVAGLAGVVWFGLTTLRIIAAGPAQKDPASWGIKRSVEAKGESAA